MLICLYNINATRLDSILFIVFIRSADFAFVRIVRSLVRFLVVGRSVCCQWPRDPGSTTSLRCDRNINSAWLMADVSVACYYTHMYSRVHGCYIQWLYFRFSWPLCISMLSRQYLVISRHDGTWLTADTS